MIRKHSRATHVCGRFKLQKLPACPLRMSTNRLRTSLLTISAGQSVSYRVEGRKIDGDLY
jgi:hypothetical protein